MTVLPILGLMLMTMAVSHVELVILKGYDLVYKVVKPNVPRALLVNEEGEPVQSLARTAFTACLFAKLENVVGNTRVSLFSFSSQEDDQVREIFTQLDYQTKRTSFIVHGNSAIVNAVPPRNEWTHICTSWETKTGTVNIYFDGVQVGKYSYVGKSSLLGNEGYLILGQHQQTFNGNFDANEGVHGKITQFNFWNRVLTSKEVTEVQNCNIEGNVVSWSNSSWKLDELLEKEKSENPCRIPAKVQGCDCIKSATETFQNLLQTYKTEIQDKLSNTTQEINDVKKVDGKAEQAIAALAKRIDAKEADISALSRRINAKERDIAVLKHCCSAKENETSGEKLSQIEQVLKSEISSLKKEISSLRESCNAMKETKVFYKCPNKFINLEKKCYYFSTYAVEWDEALKECKALDSQASLLTVESSEEWNYLKRYIKDDKENVWWIGGTDKQSEGNWTWASTGKPIGITAWCNGEPNGWNIENCADIRPDREEQFCLNDNDCEVALLYICKTEMANII